MLLWTCALFALLTWLFSRMLIRYWADPKAALLRVQGPGRVARLRHPSLAFRDLLQRLGNVLPSSRRDAGELQRLLVRAGIRGPGGVRAYHAARLVLAAGLPLAVAILWPTHRAEGRLLAIAGSAALGYVAPQQYVRYRARRHARALRRGLPHALDLMVVCVESGLGLDQAMMQVAKELEFAHRDISQEFAIVNLEMKAGKRRPDALRNLAERTGVPELRKLVGVLIQADRFGASVANSLRSHADFLRVQTRQEVEEKAAKLGVKLTFPIFFFIVPSLFVITLGPVIYQVVTDLLPMLQNL